MNHTHRPRSPRLLVAAACIVIAASLAVEGASAAPRPPAPPTAAWAVGVTSGQVVVQWEPGAGGVTTGYVVRRDGNVVARLDARRRTFTDNTVVAGTWYRYEVQALGSHRSSSSGTTASVQTPLPPDTPDTTPPTVPDQVSAGRLPDRSVLVDWQASSDDSDVSAYVVRRDGQRIATLDAGTLSYVDRHPGRNPRQYTVEAVDIVGLRSGQSEPVQPTSDAVPPETGAGGSPSATAGISAVPAYAAALRRYPYLTDLVNSTNGTAGYATVNWATDRSATTGSVRWGAVAADGTCNPTTSVTAVRTAITVNTAALYQWKANLTLQPDRQYCYRVLLGPVDLLGGDPSPRFRTQVAATSTTPFTFAVIGDWGSVDSVSANTNQAALMQQLASSGVRFAITTGDNAYPSGSQSNYGDLVQSGANISAVFGPQYWGRVGATVPLFPAIGNHGFQRSDTVHPHLVNWPQDRAVSTSGGRYTRETYCCLLGTTSVSLPSTWYAFDAGPVRIYVLEASWSDSNGGVNDSSYEVDAAYHWAPTSAEYAWLEADLAAHPTKIKMAAFHYPLYSDQKAETSDTFLQGAGSLQGLLDRYGVKFSFTGHAHIYQRNRADGGGLIDYLTGGGGAKLQSVAENPCLAIDAFALGWSNTKGRGNACGSATAATSQSQVFHFLKVTVSGSTVTIAPTNALGQTFDVQTYAVGP